MSAQIPSVPIAGGEGTTRFLKLSVAVLLLAGVFALALVVARMPPFDRLVTDPLFARRCLVVHVSLSLIVWFHAFTAGLTSLLVVPGRAAPWTRAAPFVAAIGVVFMGVAAALPGALPILSNYLPRIDHSLFTAGQLVFGAGVLLAILDRRLIDDPPPGALVDAAIPGLRTAAVLLVIAALTFGSSALALPPGLPPDARAELLYWGGGHVLQASSVAAMLSVWCMLLGDLTGRSPVSRPVAAALFGALLAPWLIAPLLPLFGVTTGRYLESFTMLMRFGIFAPTLAFAWLCGAAIVRGRQRGEIGSLMDPRVIGVIASIVLTLTGFVLGAFIRGSTTIIPAHYHASIGAVTVAFMAVAPMLLARSERPGAVMVRGRIDALQPLLYGAGQLVFAIGFAFARSTRKTYGVEQAGRGSVETVGLVVMGLGGAVAMAGGILFLAIFIKSWLRTRRSASPASRTRRESWQSQIEAAGSGSRS